MIRRNFMFRINKECKRLHHNNVYIWKLIEQHAMYDKYVFGHSTGSCWITYM